MACKITVHDVGHGVFIDVETGNGRKAIIDCGGDGDSDSSPLLAMNPTEERQTLDYLVLSHPNRDHIKHLPLLAELFYVKVLFRNRAITKQKLREENEDAFGPSNRECVDAYYDYSANYTQSVSHEDSPEHLDWGDGCTMHCFCNHDEDMSVNDLSVVVFIVSGDRAVLCGADLEQAGWEALMEDPDFVDMLRKTRVLVASHHGRESGFYRDAFDELRPLVTIVSDGHSVDTSVTERYDEVTVGTAIDGDMRKVLTTRKDGTITICVDDYGHPYFQLGSSPTANC